MCAVGAFFLLDTLQSNDGTPWKSNPAHPTYAPDSIYVKPVTVRDLLRNTSLYLKNWKGLF